MRQLTFLVVLVGCNAGEPERQAVTPSAAPTTSDLVCPPSTPSGLRGKDPKDGGYLALSDDAAVDALSAAIKAGAVFHETNDTQKRFDALQGAMSDMRPEIQSCLRTADGAKPETQYELVLTMTGDSAGSHVIGTSVKRVDGVNADHTPLLAKTDAEACVAKLFARLALPPGNGLAEYHTFIRYDFCMPTATMALATVGVYADAYRRWSADHRGTACPAALSDLNSYARRTNTDDPWSQPYVMRCSANAFEVLSAGPDRRLGTADDLTSRR
jgi:hypothetical protein